MKVLVIDHIFPHLDLEREILARHGIDLVVNRRYEGDDGLIPLAREADGILAQEAPVTARLIDALERCRVIVRYGVGVDAVDVKAATRRGIAVCNVPDYCTDDVADHTVALLLALLRRLPQSDAALRRGYWGFAELAAIRRLNALTFGIYGFGRIGRAVAARLNGFGGRVLAHDPFIAASVFAQAGVQQVDRDQLLADSDALCLHMPLTAETRHLIDVDALARMKPGACLVNAARGGLVDTVALAGALEAGRLAGAALDVFETEPPPSDHPILRAPNLLATGHLAWYSEQSLVQLQRSVGEEAARVLSGQEPRNCVNPDYRRYGRPG